MCQGPPLVPRVPTDNNSTSRDPVEKKDETPFGVSGGVEAAGGRGWGGQAWLPGLSLGARAMQSVYWVLSLVRCSPSQAEVTRETGPGLGAWLSL